MPLRGNKGGYALWVAQRATHRGIASSGVLYKYAHMSLVLAHQPSGLGGITHASCLVFTLNSVRVSNTWV